MRYLLTFIFLVSAFFAQAQQVNPVTDYTFANKMSAGRSTVTDTAAYFSVGPRFGAIRGMMPPIVVDTAVVVANKRNGLLIFSVQKNKLQVWDSAGSKWADLTGSAGSAITSADTAAMLLPYLRKADTTAMLLPYLRKGDTTAMLLPYLRDADTTVMLSPYFKESDTVWISNRVNLKVNISDTGTMLSPYLRDADTTSMLTAYLRKGDTASMLSPYLKESDTAFLSNRINLKLNISDTSTMLSPYARTATVNAADALKLNISDTSSMLSPYLRKVDTTAMLSPYARASNVNASLATKLNISDTATMLAPYLKESDTAFLSNRINLKVNISDTATMLSPYLKESDTTFLSNRINLKVNISDTSSMLGNYIRHAGYGLTKSGQALSVDTAAIATRARVQKGIDSVATLASAGVTSVATGYGLSGGTITTTGTIIADSNFVASRLRVGKVVDSLALVKQNVLTNPVTGTGTTNYVPKFTGTSTIGNSTIFDDGTNVGIGTTSMSQKLDVNGNIRSTGQFIADNPTIALLSLRLNGTSIGRVDVFNNDFRLINFHPSSTTIISGNGDINLTTAGVSNMLFGTSNVERARINSSGELLLNTTIDAGDYKLQVSGNAYVTGTTVLAATSGNVGIRTTTPGRNMEVYSATTDTRIAVTNTTTGAGAAKGLELAMSVADSYIYSYGTGIMYLGSNNTIALRLSPTGSVGIGGNALDKFTVIQDQDATSTMRIRNNNSGSSSYAQVMVNAFGSSWGMRMGSSSANSNAFEIVGSADGTPSVKAKFHTNGGMRFMPQSAAPTAEAGTVYYDTDDNKLKLYDGTNWVDLN